MSKTIEDVFQKWVEGESSKTSRGSIATNVDGSLRSTRQDPLARKDSRIIINGDQCCGGFMGHTHYNIRLAAFLRNKHPYAIIPFSAVRMAAAYLNTAETLPYLEVLDTREDEWKQGEPCTICKSHDHDSRYSCKCECHHYKHTLGASLFKIKDHYLLSTFDTTQRVGAYSLMLLPKPATSIYTALLALMPKEVKRAVDSNPEYKPELYQMYTSSFHNWCGVCQHKKQCRTKDCTSYSHKKEECLHERRLHNFGTYRNNVMRQGEWFLVPTDREFKSYEKNIALPGNNQGRANHITTRFHKEGEQIFISGKLIHRNKEHYSVYMGNTWYAVFLNKAVMSWTASGRFARVD